MRRVYYVTPRRQRLKAEMLKTLREARDSIDPALLQEARGAIAKAFEGQIAQNPEKSEKIPVDRKQIVSTVMKFLELKADNKVLHRSVCALLSEFR